MQPIDSQIYGTGGRVKERAVLVGVGKRYRDDMECGSFSRLDELGLLAATAGAEVVGVVTQFRDEVFPTYYIGKGKAEELKNAVERTRADMVIFDNDLTPAQLANLEKLLDRKVVDRSGLILDIFALRARTRQAKTQVELAQLKYLLPRLTRQWTHLSRQQGGIGTRGPGETQLEVDRRRIRARISHLERVLSRIERSQTTGRKRRRDCFKTALVGYTNAGKSTLLNVLSGSGVPVENKLFKTLDSVTRLVRYDSSPDILISDTVGFIRALPHDLIASFKSTLDEVREADLLIHVVDITNPEWEEQTEVVMSVLSELGVSDTETITVFNKTDRLEHPVPAGRLGERFPNSLFVSGKTGEGIDELKAAIVASSMKDRLTVTMRFGPGDGDMLREVYRYGTVLDSRVDEDELELTFTIPKPAAERLRLADPARR